MSRVTIAEGVEIPYVRSGTGRQLVMLHIEGVEGLAAHFDVFAFQPGPGVGAPELCIAFQRLMIARPLMICGADEAEVAAAVAAKRPPRGLVTIGHGLKIDNAPVLALPSLDVVEIVAFDGTLDP